MLEALLKKGAMCLSRFALIHKVLPGITVNLESQWEFWIGQSGHMNVHLIASDRNKVQMEAWCILLAHVANCSNYLLKLT